MSSCAPIASIGRPSSASEHNSASSGGSCAPATGRAQLGGRPELLRRAPAPGWAWAARLHPPYGGLWSAIDDQGGKGAWRQARAGWENAPRAEGAVGRRCLLYRLDANVLIGANRDYYSIGRVPEFWDWLVARATQQQVKIPLEILEEILAGREDDLTRWLSENRDVLLLDETVDEALVARVTEQGYAPDLTEEEVEKETGALARRLPAGLPAVSGSTGRFRARWDLFRSPSWPTNAGCSECPALAGTDYESCLQARQDEGRRRSSTAVAEAVVASAMSPLDPRVSHPWDSAYHGLREQRRADGGSAFPTLWGTP